MSNFLSDITSLYWWIGVVVMGILINLISSYLKPQIDSFTSKYSISKREKNKKKQDWRIKKLEKLKSNQNEKLLLYMQISGNYLRCIVFLLFGIIFYSLPNVLFDLISSINIATDTRLSNSYEYYYQTFTPILGYGFGSF